MWWYLLISTSSISSYITRYPPSTFFPNVMEYRVYTGVFQKKHFFKKINSTTHHALAWGLVWKDPKGFLIPTKFRGASGHFRFDLFYIVDFHLAHSQPGHMRAEWKSTIWNKSKQKWLEAPLNSEILSDPFKLTPRLMHGGLYSSFSQKSVFFWNTLVFICCSYNVNNKYKVILQNGRIGKPC